MKRRSLFLLSLFAPAAPRLISHAARDAQLNLTGASGMGAQQGQSLLHPVSRGIANDPAQELKNAQDAVRDGPKESAAVPDSAGKFTFKSVPIGT